MKTMRAMLLLLPVVAGSIASAQTVEFIVVGKQQAFDQVDNTTTVAAATPWSFHVGVEGMGPGGDNLSGIATPTISLPGGSTGSTTFTYDAGDDQWGINVSYGSMGLLDAAYANGSYSVTARGQTLFGIMVTGDSYPVAPVASLSGGTISSGVLNWDLTQALTITIGGSGIDHMGIFVFGSSYSNGTEGFGVTTKSFILPANTMVAGQYYTVELGFDDIVGATAPDTVSGGVLDGAQYAGVYTTQTKFQIYAIPEPTTYAAIFGTVALAGVALHRRRRLA